VKRLLRSFGFAFSGIGHALATQPNFRIHIAISSAVVIAGLILGITRVEWAVLALTIGVVLQAELFNTAIEAIVDKATPEHHPLAKIAKDCAAAAVVVCALAAVGVGLFVFGPRVLALLGLS
jgi:diacylglycerol kinase (ATP)